MINSDIPYRWDIPDEPLNTYQQKKVIDLRRVEFRGDQGKLFNEKAKLSPSKSFFTQTAFGRTLSGRNKAGKNIRRAGGTILGVGLGLLGLDSDIVHSVSQVNPDQWLPVLDKIESILIIVGGIITTITQLVDKSEISREKRDEQEIAGGKTPLARKINPKR